VTPVAEISEVLRALLADVFALFVKTKSFHWHIGGRHFREDHLCSMTMRRRSST